jgi:hypothetical protein
MRSEVLLNFFSPVPWRSINVNPDFETSESMAYMSENIKKALTIPFRGPNQPPSAQKRGHPARKIQTLSMLACCWNLKRLSPFCPSSAQAGMQAKTCLVLKDNGLLGLKASEFFLTTDETAWHLPNGPEGRHSLHASSDNLTDASTSGLVEPSDLSQSISSNGQPALGHPIPPETTQTPEDSSLDDPAVVGQAPRSVVQDGQAEALVEETRYLLGSPHRPIDSSSCGLDPVLGLSIPNAGPPVPATEPRSSYQPRLPGLAGQGLTAAREPNRGDVTIVSSWTKYIIDFMLMSHNLIRSSVIQTVGKDLVGCRRLTGVGRSSVRVIGAGDAFWGTEAANSWAVRD